MLLLLAIAVLLVPAVQAWSTVTHRCYPHQKYDLASLNMVSTRKTQRFWNRATKTMIRDPVPSQPRPTVTYDPTLGTITSSASDSGAKEPWTSFKAGIYKRVDAVGSLVAKLRPGARAVTPPRDGYHELVEQRIFQDATLTSPGERLMKEYRQRPPPLQVVQPEDSPFDSFKESIYSAADMLFRDSKPKLQRPPSAIQSFKASVQPNIAASVQVREALPQLNSRNPFKRWRAERTIQQWERQQRLRDEALEREQQIQAIKEAVYAVVDTVQAGATLVVETPQTVAKVATATQEAALSFVEWAASVPATIQSTADAVVALPGKVNQAVVEVQETVETTVQSTQKFIADVAAIPQTVADTIEGTQRSVENTVKAVDNAVTTAKIWTGLEKPPPPPPKDPTLTELAWDIAGGVTVTSAKIVWLLGKSAVQLGWKGAQAIVAASAKETTTRTVTFTTAAEIPPTPPKTPPPPQALIVNANLNENVSEQLQQAQRTLAKASSEPSSSDELEMAVRRAKDAAIAATLDAIEVEKMITKGNEDQ